MPWDWDKLQQQKKRSSSSGDAGAPPSLDEIVEKFKGLKGRFPGGIGIVFVAIIIIIFAFSCFYTVGVNEVGIIQRFGEYVRTTPPGLHFKLPMVIEKVTKVKVDFVFKEEFGFRTLQAGVQTRYASGSAYLGESLMLTGDLNVAVVPWIVQYRINDPYKYLFKVKNSKSTLRDLAESSMRLVVGDRSINEVISKRKEIADAAQEVLQKELDEAETGIKVRTIEMKNTSI